jgi:N-acetylneuraminic acid mutarotase
MPTNRSGIAGAAVNGRIHVFGGETPRGTLSTNEAYDPASNSWAAAEPMPTSRHAVSVAAVASKDYIFGGGLTVGVSATPTTYAFSP